MKKQILVPWIACCISLTCLPAAKIEIVAAASAATSATASSTSTPQPPTAPGTAASAATTAAAGAAGSPHAPQTTSKNHTRTSGGSSHSGQRLHQQQQHPGMMPVQPHQQPQFIWVPMPPAHQKTQAIAPPDQKSASNKESSISDKDMDRLVYRVAELVVDRFREILKTNLEAQDKNIALMIDAALAQHDKTVKDQVKTTIDQATKIMALQQQKLVDIIVASVSSALSIHQQETLKRSEALRHTAATQPASSSSSSSAAVHAAMPMTMPAAYHQQPMFSTQYAHAPTAHYQLASLPTAAGTGQQIQHYQPQPAQAAAPTQYLVVYGQPAHG